MEYRSSFGPRRVFGAVFSKFLYILAAIDLVFWIWAIATGHRMGGLAHILLLNTIMAASVQFWLDRRESRHAEMYRVPQTPETNDRRVA